MRKRPLCFICITLVLVMWIVHTSGGLDRSSDVVTLGDRSVELLGKIYQCEYENNKQVLYLKQTSLFVYSQYLKLNNVKITSDDMSELYQVGDTIIVMGEMQVFDQATNPGQFDMCEYYQSKKISHKMWNPKLELAARPRVSVIRGLWKLRCKLAYYVDQILPSQEGALIKGMALGDKSSIREETKLSFQNAGLSHLLAISGLHLQLLGNGLYRLLRKIRVGLYGSAIASALFLICYGSLTGNSVATVRALVMFLLGVGADITGRTYDGFTGIALTALVLVAGNPGYFMNSGFWMSFCAVSALSLFKEKRKLFSGVIFYFFMAPITLYYFYELPLYSTVINLLVVPTAGVVLVSGLLGAIGASVSLILGRVLAFPAVVLLRIYSFLCDINESIPCHTLVLGRPTIVQIMLYYTILGVMLWLFRKNALRMRRVVVLSLIIPAICALLYRGVSGVQITMLDVGQGDAFVIRTETGTAYLIDGGSTTEDRIGEYRILPYLKHEGIRNIEGVFISHADADHMNGVLELLELIKQKKVNLTIKRIILPYWEDMSDFENIINLAASIGIEIYRFDKGQRVHDGELSFTCLHPNGESFYNKTNEGSMVLRIDYKAFSIMFTGDLEGQSEKDLLGSYGDIDVLKVGHHGSDTSSSQELLEEACPEIALISCGENNPYGHPHEEVLERLTDRRVKIFRTDHHGAVTIRTDGEKIDLKTYKQYNIEDNCDCMQEYYETDSGRYQTKFF